MQKEILKISCQLNPRTHQNYHSPQASRLHPSDAGMVQYTESIKVINYIFKVKGKMHIISLDIEKPFDKIEQPFILKVLERTGIQGPYLNAVIQYIEIQ